MSVDGCYRLQVLMVVTSYECWWLLQVTSVGGCYRL